MRYPYVNKEVAISLQPHKCTTAQMGGSVVMYLWDCATMQPHMYRTMQLHSSVNTQPHNCTFTETGGSAAPILHISAFVRPWVCAVMHLLNYTTAQPHN